MSTSKYRNRDALDKALRTYLEAMYSFVNKCLGEGVIRDTLRLPSDSNIEEKIEVKDIAHLIRTWPHWDNYFKKEFKIIDRDDIRYYDARSVTSLIVEGRNQVAHKALKDLDREFTRVQLFLIAEILGKIDRLNEQREVEKIRDKCFVEIEQDKANLEELLAAKEKKLKKLSEKMINNAVKLEEKNKEIEKLADTLERKEEKNKELAEKFLCEKLEKKKYQDQHNSISNQLATGQTERDAYKEQVETLSDELKEVKVERDTAKEDFVAISNELTSVQAEKNASEKYLAVTRDLLTTVAIGDQAVFPSLNTNAAIRIIDRRGTDKHNYLLQLLEQKQSTIIYVQSEEKINQLLTRVLPEKADVIGKHNEQISDAQEREMLEKLARGELIAIVSSATISTLLESHCVEHFVFCHLAPDLDVFFERCQPASTSTRDVYFHLIYESKRNIEALEEKYPNEEALRKLYQKFRDRTPINEGFINPENLYSELCPENELDMARVGIETGLSIFEELGFLEQSKEGIRRLSTTRTELEESKIYRSGEKLKKEAANCPTFQYEKSIAQIWKEIVKKLDVENEQIVRENSIHRSISKVSEIEDDARSVIGTEQDEVTPPNLDVWPLRTLNAFNSLRHRVAKEGDIWFEDGRSTLRSPFASYEFESPAPEDAKNEKGYQRKYGLAMQFAQEHGFSALEQGIAELIKDQDDPNYDFTEDEANMLLAFQDTLRNFQTQSEQSTEAVEKDNEAVEAITPPSLRVPMPK